MSATETTPPASTAPSRSSSPPKTPGAATTDLSGSRPPRFNNGWTKEQEELMAGWADISACYRWMHDRCEKISARSNMSITVPVIILSTLTGSANFIMGGIVGDNKQLGTYVQIGIGGVSIFTGILTTLGNFFRYAQASESHRVSGIAWGKFQRQIAVELALHPRDRLDSMDFLKICRSELDRLIEQSPPIPDNVIKAFEREFQDLKNLKKPDIAHGVDHTHVFHDNDSRLRQLAIDAAIHLRQKKKVLNDALIPEIDRRVSDLSGSLFTSLHARVRELEENVDRTSAPIAGSLHGRSLLRRQSQNTSRRSTSPLTRQLVNTTVPETVPTSKADLLSALQVSPDHIEVGVAPAPALAPVAALAPAAAPAPAPASASAAKV